jgi:chromate reductase
MRKALLTALLVIASLPLMAEVKVLAFSGSTRTGSYNKMLVEDAAKIARQMGATVTVIDLKDYPMPFYDADLEKKDGLPANARKLRNLMADNDAIIIASPEYNHSVSAVLKNALDWASRSDSQAPSRSAFKGKKFAIMSASPGKGGGARALPHLRSIIEDVGGTVVKTQVTIPNAQTYFAQTNRPENPLLKKEIQELLQ